MPTPPPRFSSPPPPAPRPGLWRRTPPAIFPAVLGLLGLGLAWRQGAVAYLLPPGPVEAALGASLLTYLFCLVAYGAKIMRRPCVLIDEVQTLPGRAGIAALSISMMLSAAVLWPHAPGPGRVVLFAALGLHGVFAAVIVGQVVRAPAEQRPVTPLWHLHFVGFIVGGLAAEPMGMERLAANLLAATLPVAAAIWAISAWQFLRRVPPAPLRPLLAIHLAPASLFASVAAVLGLPGVAFGFAVLSVVIFVVLVASVRWLCAAGFSPFWGAFTFPIAAFAGAMMLQATPTVLIDMMGFDPAAPFWRLFGALALVLATGAVPWIVFRVLREWARGTLAARNQRRDRLTPGSHGAFHWRRPVK